MNSNNDLEEGEIADDPISDEFGKTKAKTLPRRYRLHKSSSCSTKLKKKKCVHESKFSPKTQISKKLTSRKDSHSCSRHKSSSIKHDDQNYKKTSYSYAQRTIVQRISPLKAVASHENIFPKLAAPVQRDIYAEQSNSQQLSLNSSFEDLLHHYRLMQGIASNNFPNHRYIGNQKKEHRVLSKSSKCQEVKGNNLETVDNLENLKEEDKSKNSIFDIQCQTNSAIENVRMPNVISCHVLPDSTSRPVEKLPSPAKSDDEDEEALRQIALASCLKRNNIKKTILNNKAEVPKLHQIEVVTNIISKHNLPNSDNYDIVDMDLDGDQSSNEIECEKNCHRSPNSNLFVIDTKPFPIPQQADNKQDFKKSVFNAGETICMLQNDKFEATLKTKSVPFLNGDVSLEVLSSSSIESKTSENNLTCNKQANIRKVISKAKTSLSNVSLKSRAKDDSKAGSLPLATSQAMHASKGLSVATSRVHIPAQRMIITLTNESSSDESQDDTMEENETFASLEALISSARQMSNKKTEKESNVPVEAVSCLSKAQQQEYNNLKKIIAQKELSQTQQRTVHSSSDDLKLLEKNLILALSTLQKEKRFLNGTKQDVNKKKRNFLRSQLVHQHVREQLVVAEKKKKADGLIYNKANMQLQALQNSVTKRETLINDLQRECKRLGASVCGCNYKPPSVTFPSTNKHIKNIKKLPLANPKS